ncbi:MAG: hypothetical protein II647_02525 [Bacteroidales bacterium]|jgi:uncharacterized protein (TIGR02145 family)|nr:hypothetical protein [Bacteroidales bacterium]
MKRIIVGLAFAAALLCGCQKINDLESRMKVAETDISALKSDVAKLMAAVDKKYTITDFNETATGYTITLSDGSTISLKNGADGKDGDAILKSISSENGFVVITLVDGSVYRIPLADDYPLKAVKSLTYIPDFFDGSATVSYKKAEDATATMKFMVRPASATTALMKAVEAGSVKILPFATSVATRSLANEVTELSCRSFSIDPDGLLTVKVNASGLGEDFFAGKAGAAIAVVISDGVSEISSAFVPLVPECTGLEYGGEIYGIAKMADGKTWMTENLRYVPEGYVPCSDLGNVTGGVYMPVVVADGKAAFSSDNADIERQGYLYQSEVALGLNVGDLKSVQDAMALEGAQGICPDGWHIPTLSDYLGLVGKSVGADTVADAPYYDGKNGSIQMLNADGFNLFACGAVSIQDNTKTSATLMGKAANYDYISSGFICGSTYAGCTVKDDVLTNIQFFGLMPMTNKATEAEFTANGSKLSYRIAAAVRCVKD